MHRTHRYSHLIVLLLFVLLAFLGMIANHTHANPANTLTPRSHFPFVAHNASLTPTATPTPITDTQEDGAIPDDHTKSLTSSIEISEDVYVREVKVFIWIDHDDTFDLRIELSPPTGDTILLRPAKAEETGGPTSIRERYLLTRDELTGVDTSQGTWSLIVTDTKPGNTGELRVWALEIYP